MVGRKTMMLLSGLLVIGACGPAAKPKPVGPTPAELEAQAEEKARQEAEAQARAKAEQMASPGMTRARAIEVCKPDGQRAYLSRLRCPGGSEPTIVGRSSVGLREPAREGQDELVKAQFDRAPNPGEPDLHVVDRYDVDCGDGKPLSVFLDMYHCPAASTDAVPIGLELVAEGATPDGAAGDGPSPAGSQAGDGAATGDEAAADGAESEGVGATAPADPRRAGGDADSSPGQRSASGQSL